MEIERSLEPITLDDLADLYAGSVRRLGEYFVDGAGKKWGRLYDIGNPLGVALCQGAALHYQDKANGVKDFDVWFFYPFNQTHLPYRTIWNWDYRNPKFGHRAGEVGYTGRRVDVLVRSIHAECGAGPVDSIQSYLSSAKSSSARALSKKAVVLLSPEPLRGKVVWYRKKT